MKTSTVQIFFALLISILSASAFAQFANKNSAFEQPGVGEADRMYSFQIPDGITVEDAKKGTVMKSGEIVSVPGKFIKLVDTSGTDKTKAVNMFFNMKNNLPEPSHRKEFSAIELTIPEWVTVRYQDGRVMKGPSTLMLLIKSESMQRSEKIGTPMQEFEMTSQGFQNK